jgi:hypothetical protein
MLFKNAAAAYTESKVLSDATIADLRSSLHRHRGLLARIGIAMDILAESQNPLSTMPGREAVRKVLMLRDSIETILGDIK